MPPGCLRRRLRLGAALYCRFTAQLDGRRKAGAGQNEMQATLLYFYDVMTRLIFPISYFRLSFSRFASNITNFDSHISLRLS